MSHLPGGGDVYHLKEGCRGRSNAIRDEDGRFNTPLHDAAGHGWPHAVAVLLKHGANAAAKNWQSKTPLQVAEEAPKRTHFDDKANPGGTAELLRARGPRPPQ
jgi:hypothetical protein